MPETTQLVVISGCSGGGKSTLLQELARRGFGISEEPGRQIVQEEMQSGGVVLPWVDMDAFLARAAEVSRNNYALAVKKGGLTFFDRSLVDAASGLAYRAGRKDVLAEVAAGYPYWPTVFLVPPWRELFETDTERRHSFEDAEAEFYRLAEAYPSLGYKIAELPRVSVEERANQLLDMLIP